MTPSFSLSLALFSNLARAFTHMAVKRQQAAACACRGLGKTRECYVAICERVDQELCASKVAAARASNGVDGARAHHAPRLAHCADRPV